MYLTFEQAGSNLWKLEYNMAKLKFVYVFLKLMFCFK